MAVVVGVDGRPTLVCSAPDQKPADQGVSPGGRFRGPPVTTIRIVSFPPNGRPVGYGSGGIAVSPDPPADEPIYPERAITRPGRIAVLGGVIRANRMVPTLWVFAAGAVAYGIAPWTLERRIELTQLAQFEVGRCGLGWGDDADVLVVAAEVQRVPGRPGRPPQPAHWVLRLVVDAEGSQPRLRTVDLTIRPGLDLPSGFEVKPRVSAVRTDPGGGLLVACSFEGVDPQGGRRPIGWLDAARASVLRLRPSDSALEPDGLEPDPSFAQEGVWVASAADGEITTFDLMDLDELGRQVVAGRARRIGAWSLFAAAFDPDGALAWSSYPGDGVLEGPTGLAVKGGRIFLCGSTLKFDKERTVDPAEAVVISLSPTDGQPDPGFGVGGRARYRLGGSTYATALEVTTSGEPLLACILRWGWNASVATFHACLSRLTAAGRLDGSFGSAGVLRHDGLGEASCVAVTQAGRVWSAGVTKIFLGMVQGYRPWEQEPDFLWVLSVSQLTADGELDGAFGGGAWGGGIRTHQLGTLLPPDEMLLPTDKTEFDLASLVPLAGGGAILSGAYYRRVVVDTATGERGFEFRGSWIVRLTSTGGLDPSFGTNGLRAYPRRGPIELVRELADGTLQGFDSSAGRRDPLRLGANGDPAPGFGTNGVKPTTKLPITMPLDVEPDGEWFGPVWGPMSSTSMRWTVGLIRCGADGVIDPNFGAGAATTPNSCFVDIASVQGAGFNPDWNDQGGPHRTLRLADGTLLTIWSVSRQVVLTIGVGMHAQQVSWRPWGMVLVAWTADGRPRAVTQWGNNPAKAIPNPLSLGLSSSGWLGSGWLGWRNQCAVLQLDGSILVGLAGDDADEGGVNQTPRPLRQSACFCRLVPPGFDLDPGFGSAGILVRRLPDDGYRRFAGGDPRSARNQVDSQVPERLALVGSRLPGRGPDAVVAAISCRAVYESLLSQGGLADTIVSSPNLPFDGSVGVARLI